MDDWRELSGVVGENARRAGGVDAVGRGADAVRRGAGAAVCKALSGPGADGDVGRFMGGGR